MLNQPIVITANLNPIASIFKNDAGVVAPVTAPVILEDGWFQVRQTTAENAGQLMRPMGSGSGYSFPLKALMMGLVCV